MVELLNDNLVHTDLTTRPQHRGTETIVGEER